MCHGLCETGSTPFVPALQGVRTWLQANPAEVVTLFIEDHVAADLIAADRRLVVMLENGDGGDDAPWLVNGFDHTGETPYTFPTVADFSCAPNRGPADPALLQLNHWLSGFRSLATDADLVNARDVLLDRALQCQDERGQIPNFVAVNYVSRGDVFDVVDVFNGVADA